MTYNKSPALEKLEHEMGVSVENAGSPLPVADFEPSRNEPLRALIIIALLFASVMIWTFFIPVIGMNPDSVFRFQGEGNIFGEVFNLSFVIFLLLSPLTYGLVAALGIKQAGSRGIYCGIGILLGVLLSFFLYAWPLYYLVTGIAYALLAPAVYKVSAVKFLELKWWNSFRAASAGIGTGVNYVLIVLVLTSGFIVFPQQEVWFQKSVYSMLDYATPNESSQLSASQKFSQACFDQVITELKKPVSRESVIAQLELNPAYLALPTAELKTQYVDQTVDASTVQKDLMIAQLEKGKNRDVNAAQLKDREQMIQEAYDQVIADSPLLRQMKRFFGLVFVLSLWFTVIMFKVVVELAGGFYGGVLLKFFEYTGMF